MHKHPAIKKVIYARARDIILKVKQTERGHFCTPATFSYEQRPQHSKIQQDRNVLPPE
jgi:hypothetical protein